MRMVMMMVMWIILEQKSADEVHAKTERRDSDRLIEVNG